MNATYRFGQFELNPTTRALLADGKAVALGPRAFDVLLALIERRERLVTKNELLELAWPGLVVEENNLQVQISALRKLLGPQSITTIPGLGYRFTCSLENDVASSPDKTAESPLLDNTAIAVLPFTNMSKDKDTAFFADGVQEDLLTQLALLGELKVVSRTSVSEYRNSSKNVRQIGAELGVGSLVEGSVRRAGNRVRVTAQLIDARSDKHLWGSSYDRELKDIFAIQTELATEIARALKVSLTPSEQARLARKRTENLAAYELLLRQQDLWIRAANTTAEDALEERIALLTRAVELDPQFALAWARLGADHARAYFHHVDRSAARLARAQHAIERALALAPDDIEVRSEVGNVHYYGHRDFARAAQYFDDLLRIAPNHVETLTQLAWVRRRQGRWPESNALLERALAIDARNVSALANLRDNLVRFRHFDLALSLQRKMLDLQSGDLDEKCRLREIEWLKSGSFVPYDAWRSALPAGPERASDRVWNIDVTRAAARRDFDAILRLLDAPPKERGWDPLYLVNETRAFALLGKGERTRALELARSSLRKASADLQRQPDNVMFLHRSLLNRALLGEREAVLLEFRRRRDRPEMRTDALYGIDHLTILEPQLYALLGDRERALQALVQYLKQPSWFSTRFWRVTLSLVSLWDDPGFLAIVNDPGNNAPLPIVNRDPSLMGT